MGCPYGGHLLTLVAVVVWCVRRCASVCRPWARAISTTASRFDDGEFLNKDKFESMIPKDALDGVDTEVPVVVEGQKHYSERVTKLAEEILTLNLLETADLCDILKVGTAPGRAVDVAAHRGPCSLRNQDRLDMNDDAMFFPMPNLSGMVMAGAGPGDGGAAEAAEPVEEKTHFDLKLVSFEPKSKIKIIKEVRAATKLGLKDVRERLSGNILSFLFVPVLFNNAHPISSSQAKDLVESAPAVLLKDASKDDAEPLKEKLEELGAHMELE